MNVSWYILSKIRIIIHVAEVCTDITYNRMTFTNTEFKLNEERKSNKKMER